MALRRLDGDAQTLAHLMANPWIAAYVAGLWTGWAAARRSTAYMLGIKR